MNDIKEVLGVQTVSGLEEDRGNVKAEEVFRFYKDLELVLNEIDDPRQLINIDEEGIGSPPNKGKRKKVVFLKSNPQKPYFKEETDDSHVSIVGAITRSERIKPLLILGKQDIDPNYDQIAIRRNLFSYLRTPSGYATIESTFVFVRNILAPFIWSVRTEKQNPNLPFILIMDGLSSHKNQNIMNEINRIGHVHVMFIPPHSSHFLQPLDLFVFFEHKKIYSQALSLDKNSKSNSTGNKSFCDKVIRVIDT